MTGVLIAGIDFSGAKTVPNDTWIAAGSLTTMGLEVDEIRKVGSHKVAAEFTKPDICYSAVGIDVPFSLPSEFLVFMAEKLSKPEFQSWQEVAEQLVFMSFEQFMELVVEFKKEPKRVCDRAISKAAQSPLHRGNPSMVQMTYQGIRMLATLDPKLCAVLPFQDRVKNGTAILEVYPRQTLTSLGLPDSGYKSKDKKDKDAAHAVRRTIVENLVQIRERKGISHKDCPRLSVGPAARSAAMDSDHALDALVACYTIAMWHTAKDLFQDPLDLDQVEVLTEGWIYSPRVLN
ncbi:MAG TPA: DUF429 domain-containing protein [Drouetiella sp.]|jgi:Protein of unknown function (DUF429)